MVAHLLIMYAAMQVALNMLGIPCYHSLLFFSNIGDCKIWDEALDAKFLGKGNPFTRKDWDQLLGDHSAVADVPAIAFAEELVEAYPEAKVILVDRDIEKWYKSFDDTVIANMWSSSLRFAAKCDPWYVRRLQSTHMKWAVGWMGAHNKKEMQEKATAKYREHYALVRKLVPKDRLLEYRLGSGWEPLCEFLGKPVPDVPFPNVNETAALNEKLSIVMSRGMMTGLKRALVIVVPVIVVGSAWWFSQSSKAVM